MTVIMPLVPDQISERNYRPQTKSEASGNHGLAGQAKEEVPRVLPLAMAFLLCFPEHLSAEGGGQQRPAEEYLPLSA